MIYKRWLEGHKGNEHLQGSSLDYGIAPRFFVFQNNLVSRLLGDTGFEQPYWGIEIHPKFGGDNERKVT